MQMEKIMFNDKYGLTKAVLEGRKTMTRRIIKAPKKMEGKDVYGFAVVRKPGSNEVIEVFATDADGATINNILPTYKVGEVVAVAQAYKDTCWTSPVLRLKDKLGWSNKMFVYAGLMPHQLRITNVRVERLQDISDEDCLREGIITCNCKTYFNGYAYDWCYDQDGNILAARWYKTPRESFAALIDKVSGKGTWASNPFVFVYEFELVK